MSCFSLKLVINLGPRRVCLVFEFWKTFQAQNSYYITLKKNLKSQHLKNFTKLINTCCATFHETLSPAVIN